MYTICCVKPVPGAEPMTVSQSRSDLTALNATTQTDFVEALGGVFEYSPWVAEEAWSARPFADVSALHDAMMGVVRHRSTEDKVALLRAHPELAGRVARAGEMTPDSVAEQSSAGLDQMTEAEFARFDQLNTAYREKFGFPFIIAVRNHSKESILDRFANRLNNAPEEEIEAALKEIGAITRMRLDDLVAAENG